METDTLNVAVASDGQVLAPAKKTKKAKAPAPIAPPEPDTVATLEATAARILADIDALTALVQGTGATHAKAVRPFKRTAEDKLRLLGWAVLDPKMAAHMETLNASSSSKKAEREAKKADAALAAAQKRAEKLKADAAAKLALAEARVKALRDAAKPAAAAA